MSNFFNRIRCDKITLQKKSLFYLVIIWMLPFLFFYIGVNINGIDFLSWDFVLKTGNRRFNPYLTIVVISIVLLFCISVTLDFLLSPKCLLGFKNSTIIFLGRKCVESENVNIESLSLCGVFKNILKLYDNNNNLILSIPLIASDIKGEDALQKFKDDLLVYKNHP